MFFVELVAVKQVFCAFVLVMQVERSVVIAEGTHVPHITCFTSTKVQVLTQKPPRSLTQYTSFVSALWRCSLARQNTLLLPL
jgi:hypothetical protein